MPTVLQKWAKLLQQPMLTCWHASIICPLTGSMNEPARPPRRLRDSKRVMRNSRGASAAAAANPARPPPTIATLGPLLFGNILLRSCFFFQVGKCDVIGDQAVRALGDELEPS